MQLCFSRPIEELPFSRGVLRAWLDPSSELHGLTVTPAQADDHPGAILAQVITHQYAGIDLLPQERDSLEKLTDPLARTVTTGHQLVIMGGPWFTLFKLMATISEAHRMQAEGTRCVPIFWLAAEDDDLEEMASVKWEDAELRMDLPGKQMSGDLSCDSWNHMLDGILGDDQWDTGHAKALRSALGRCDTVVDWYRTLIHEVFGHTGLLVLDPREPVLRSKFLDVFRQECTENSSIQALQSGTERLKGMGFKAQIEPKEVNFFICEGDRRLRMQRDGSEFLVEDMGRLACEEIFNRIQSGECSYSTGVAMRPLYQQVIMPNHAYVGGPGELAYWLQLCDLFNVHGVHWPEFLPRHMGSFVTADVAHARENAGIEWDQALLSPDKLERSLAADGAAEIEALENARSEINEILKGFKGRIPSELGLDSHLGAISSHFEKELKRTRTKIVSALTRKDEVRNGQLHRVHEGLFDGGALKERSQAWLPMYIRRGHGFIDQLIEDMNDQPPSFFIWQLDW